MDDWKRVLIEGLLPQLQPDVIRALRDGILREDPRLIHGVTAEPPAPALPTGWLLDWPAAAGCLRGYCALLEGCVTVEEVQDRFAELCLGEDLRCNEFAANRHLSAWWDDNPRAARVTVLAALEEYLRREAEHAVSDEIARAGSGPAVGQPRGANHPAGNRP